nr:uncharacterized protein LOC112547749 [Pelodiscus sinensis]|eukprot:XP_025046492.1 uncharacterized protein LOC112547749 [Pelodiscus sinensis]
MDADKIVEWLVDSQRQLQRQQTEALRQLTSEFREQQKQLVRELKDGTGLIGPTNEEEEEAAGPARLPIRLTKLGAEDDAEAFLVTFERVATAARWPQEHWATILAPYLSGPAQLAYRSLSDRDSLCYYKVKEAILDQLGISPETYRQRFRAARYATGERPRAVAQRIREAGFRWLEPSTKTATQVADLVVLEQYLQVLPAEGQQWVRRHLPGTLEEAVTLMEHFLAAETPEGPGKVGTTTNPVGRGGPSPKGKEGRDNTGSRAGSPPVRGPERRLAPVWRGTEDHGKGEPRAEVGKRAEDTQKIQPKPTCYQCGQEGHIRRDCPMMDCTYGQPRPRKGPRQEVSRARMIRRIRLNGEVVEAVLDSGCGQTLVRRDALGRSGHTGAQVWIKCVHGDTRPYPTAQVRLHDRSQGGELRVAVTHRLPYPVLLGRDWPGLRRLLGERGPTGVRDTREAWATQEEEETMPPQGLDGEEARMTLEVDTGDFLALQREDPSLQHAWENALEPRVEDEGTQQQSEQGPHFEIQGDRLYRVPGTAGGETQLLVPKAYRWTFKKIKLPLIKFADDKKEFGAMLDK